MANFFPEFVLVLLLMFPAAFALTETLEAAAARRAAILSNWLKKMVAACRPSTMFACRVQFGLVYLRQDNTTFQMK